MRCGTWLNNRKKESQIILCMLLGAIMMLTTGFTRTSVPEDIHMVTIQVDGKALQENTTHTNPQVILAAIEKGIKPTGGKYEVIENRREAIRRALEIAEDGDVIVLAGKGHETYQEIMGVKRPFDEKVIVSELLLEMKKREEKS